jgi:hypothetical protein
MSMWPRLFLWLNTTVRCWLGILRPSLRKNLPTKGVASLKFTKRIEFKESLCYPALKKTIRPQKGELLRISSLDGRFQNQFLTVAAKADA